MAAKKKASRKKAARRKPASSGGGGVWPAMLGITALRVFTGAVFLGVAHWKLIKPGLPLKETIVRFTELDYLPLVQHAVLNPPEVFGTKWSWFSDLLESVALGGNAPYVIAGAVLFFEALLGISLILGACVRLMAFLGAILIAVMGLAKGLFFLTVTQGTNWYLVMILLALSLMAAGRIWGLDSRLRHRLPGWIA
ncbi:MAG: hypothetical protein QNJ90_04150 [Planctomycetota bacterium]|nr:hypothetical protein [Planctomycetota bacterium]